MAGAGFKTFNTGDVLTASDVNTYLMQQTVMVFADSSARSTALGANVAEGMISYLKDTNAVEVYDGSNWVSSDDPNAIQNTIVDAKGDIITATAADTPARLAVGTSGNVLASDSSTATGLAYIPTFFAGKNKILNSDFSIWQRSTSATVTSETYLTCDRYRSTYIAGGATVTWSQQSFTAGAAPVAGYEGQYFSRISATSGSGTTVIGINQRIEDVRTLANQTATFSFWAKADSARTATILIVQNFGSGGSADVTVLNTTQALTTGWVRYSFNATVPSISGKTIGSGSYLVAYVYFNTGQASGSPQLDLWGWQLEAGSTATQFQTATGNPASELAACQRYYYRVTPTDTVEVFGNGIAISTTQSLISVPFPVKLRVLPTALEQSGTASHYRTMRANATQDDLTAVPAYDAATSSSVGFILATSANLVAGNATLLFSNSTSAYLGWSAEL